VQREWLRSEVADVGAPSLTALGAVVLGMYLHTLGSRTKHPGALPRGGPAHRAHRAGHVGDGQSRYGARETPTLWRGGSHANITMGSELQMKARRRVLIAVTTAAVGAGRGLLSVMRRTCARGRAKCPLLYTCSLHSHWRQPGRIYHSQTKERTWAPTLGALRTFLAIGDCKERGLLASRLLG
jgi:hypothetical protein